MSSPQLSETYTENKTNENNNCSEENQKQQSTLEITNVNNSLKFKDKISMFAYFIFVSPFYLTH